MVRRGSRRRRNQRGFALLFVFAMAAGVAIMLYLEMPRIAFERQRDKEEMLVQRGEQFVRGITVFYRKNGRFPQTMDELEKYNNIRYLRRRYKDPMTGQDEWRLIHVDAAGRYLDSLVHKPAGQEEETKQRHLLEADVQGIGASAVSATEESQGASRALQRRGSDIIIPNTPGSGRGQNTDPNADPNAAQSDESRSGDQNQAPQPTPVPSDAPPVRTPGITNSAFGGQNPNQGTSNQGMLTGNRQAGFAGQTGLNQSGIPATPGQQQQTGQQQQQSSGGFGFSGGGFGMSAQAPPAQSGTGQSNTSQQGQPGGVGSQPNDGRGAGQGLQQGAQQGLGGSQGNQQRPMNPGTTYAQPNLSGNPLPSIQNLMVGSRPPGSTQGSFGQSQQPGAVGGIAGVASTVDLEGIKIYNERTNYKEWEFLFDLQKAQQSMANPGGGQGAMGGRGQQGQGQSGSSPNSNNPFFTPSSPQRGLGGGSQGNRPNGPGSGGGSFGFGGGSGNTPRPVGPPGQGRP